MDLDQNDKPAQSTPSQDKTNSTDTQPHGDPIASARRQTDTAREKLQSAYTLFQTSKSLSEAQISDAIYQSKSSIDGISDLFVHLPLSSSLEICYKLACEERYIYERIIIIAAYSLRNEDLHSPVIFRAVDREFQKIFSSLANLENLITQLQGPFPQSDDI